MKNNSRTYPSMKAAAAGMKIPAGVLQGLKARNCPGFQLNGRVRQADVEKFVTEHKGEPLGDPLEGYDPLKAKQLEKIQFELEIRRGIQIPLRKEQLKWSQAMEVVQKVMGLFIAPADYNTAIEALKNELEALPY